MKIGILEAGKPRDEIVQYGRYADKVARFIASSASTDTFTFEYFAVVENEFPESAACCDGWAITGSRHGVYERLAWMPRLERLIHDIVAQGQPLFGICFGHQIIAAALGGQVEKSSKGWGIGLHDYQLSNDLPCYMGDSRGMITLNAFHQDQVTQPPTEAEVLASSNFCPNAILAYGDNVLTMQAHPEFDTDYDEVLIHYCLKLGVFEMDTATPALARLSQEPNGDDGQEVARWCKEFYLDRAAS